MIARHCRNIKIASLFLLLFPCKLILISTASKRIFRFFKADKSHCFQTQKQGQNAANSVIKQAKNDRAHSWKPACPDWVMGRFSYLLCAGAPKITASRGWQPVQNDTPVGLFGRLRHIRQTAWHMTQAITSRRLCRSPLSLTRPKHTEKQ